MSLSERLKNIEKQIEKLEKKRDKNRITGEEQNHLNRLIDQRIQLNAHFHLEETVLQRIAMRDAILKRYSGLLMVSSSEAQGGDLQFASHLVTMKEEGVAIILLLDLIVFAAQFAFNVPYLVHKGQFKDAIEKQQAELAKGNNIQLVYLPDDEGNWPEVYPMDDDGEVDYFAEPYPNGDAPLDAVRANGLVPPPRFEDGYAAAMSWHMQRVNGDVLTYAQKLQAGMAPTTETQNKAKVNPLRDRTMYKNFRPK